MLPRCIVSTAIAALVVFIQPSLVDAFCSLSTSPCRQQSLYLAYSDNFDHDVGEKGREDSRGRRQEYLATCIPGLAPYLEKELSDCGVSSTQVLSDAAVSFSVSDETVPLKVLLWVRTAHRLLEKIDTFFDLESRDDVYDAVQNCRLPVKDLLGDGQGGLLSLSVKVIANGRLPKDISHSHYTALTIKNALVDQVRQLKDGERPDVDLDDPDVPLVAIFHGQGMRADMTMYRSLAPPGSLHKRGYRSGGAIHKAAMKESLAAGLLLAAGWNEAVHSVKKAIEENDSAEGLTLVDPMCGSGSLLVEAAMMTVNFPPGLMRIINHVPGHQVPPVLRWKGNKDSLMPIWKEMLLGASTTVKKQFAWLSEHDGIINLIGNDIHPGALELVEASLKSAGGLDRLVDLHQNDCQEWNVLQGQAHDDKQVWVVTNPPWGVRLTDDDHMSWESLRTFLRTNCPPGRTQAWVLSGNKLATKHLGLRRSQSVVAKTGQQDLRWIQYKILEKREVYDNKPDSNQDAQVSSDDSNPPRRIMRTRNVNNLPSTQVRRRTKKPPSKNVSNADDSWI
ncbi:methyltransferase K/L [Seminavis robusta]|uniref:Methyltransferase K/L n=1 Tax=Seminavis robusta TaxID=568900 RepID=A0A9N8EE64_9STRA|nr:methyltransferase K/L [Seminavis robusta]|eukprot:Sro864_g212670.1 methyltransferase K/L (562) ;mRNA; r:31428-33186